MTVPPPMPRLRIALFTHSVHPRGGPVHVLELGAALHALGHAVTVFAPAQAGQTLFRAVPHAVSLVPVADAPASLGALVAQRIEAFKTHLLRSRAQASFDIFHAHDGIGGNALADLAEAGLIDGFVRTVHHLDPFDAPGDDPRLPHWQTRSVRAAALVLCVSALWRDAVQRLHGVDAARVHNGVDLARFTPHADARDALLAVRFGLRAGRDPQAPVFLCVGGIEARKNTPRVVQAFLRLRTQWPQAQLVIAGGASLLDHSAAGAEVAQALSQAGITPGTGRSVVLTGTLDDADMPALMRSADVLVMASLREGFGLVVLEALASGTPVVAAHTAPFTEYLADTVRSGHAVWADPRDTDSIAAAMAQAVQPARRQALAAALPLTVCVQHDWPSSAARHAVLYAALKATSTRVGLVPAPAA